MKWVNLLPCSLPVEVAQQWVRSLKGFLVWSLKAASKSMTWRWQGRVGGMKTFSVSKSKLQTQDRQKRPRRRENYWRLLGLVPCVLVLSCVRSSPPRNWSLLPTQTAKVEQSSSSALSHGQQVKSRSPFLLDTSALWETSPSFPVFWDSISGHRPADND